MLLLYTCTAQVLASLPFPTFWVYRTQTLWLCALLGPRCLLSWLLCSSLSSSSPALPLSLTFHDPVCSSGHAQPGIFLVRLGVLSLVSTIRPFSSTTHSRVMPSFSFSYITFWCLSFKIKQLTFPWVTSWCAVSTGSYLIVSDSTWLLGGWWLSVILHQILSSFHAPFDIISLQLCLVVLLYLLSFLSSLFIDLFPSN